MELNELPHLPGLATAMAAGKMGDKLFVGLTLPSTYPAPALRGQKIEMLVDINAAAEVSLLAEDSPELLKHLNRGKTLEEVMVAIRQELIDEAGDQLVREGHLLVLAKLVERAGAIPVTADQIDAEIVADWKRLEGKKMEEKQLDRTTLESAKLGWLHDPSTRRDAELRIKVSLVIRAIAERDGIKVTPESLKEQLVRTVPGMDEAGANEALNETMETTAVLAEYGLYLATVEHVMKHAEIKFAGAKA
jgi:trigger factor